MVCVGDYINLADFLKVKSTDTEAVRKAKEDVKSVFACLPASLR
jgi:hypothetical protein